MNQAFVTRWRKKSHSGRRAAVWLVVVVVVVWLPLPGMPSVSDHRAPRNLLCYKNCDEALEQCPFVCTWKAGNATENNFFVKLRYHEKSRCPHWKPEDFPAGKSTSYSFKVSSSVCVLTNVTIWVENRAVSPPLTSENFTRQIKETLKFNAPSIQPSNLSKLNGILTLKWPLPSDRLKSAMKTEVRMKPRRYGNWTLANCDSKNEEDDMEIVACHMGQNMAYQVQIRYRTPHWSSDWSDWSQPLSVPAEILQRPKVKYVLGQLGKDGLRNVTLEWEKPNEEQEEVNYNLTFTPPCSCMDDFLETMYKKTSLQIPVFRAGYIVSLKAFNKAGGAPDRVFRVPPESGPDTSFLTISLSGKNLTVKGVADTDMEEYCFEKQLLEVATEEVPPQEDCSEESITAGEVYSRSETVELNKCYRLALHWKDSRTGIWASSGFSYLFPQNTSFIEPIRVVVANTTASSADIRWEAPQNLSACPGVLKKYLVCCRNQKDGNVMYYTVNASHTSYTILDLQPQTVYYIGVWAETVDTEEACQFSAWVHTLPADPKQMTQAFLYLGILGVFLIAAGIFHFGKKRAKKMLCPVLPDPAGTEAVKLSNPTDTAQAQLKQGFMEALESSSPIEPVIVELLSVNEEPATDTMADPPGGCKAAEELLTSKDDQVGSGNILSSEYKRQGLLNAVEDDRQGREKSEEFTGVSLKAVASCSLDPQNETKDEDSKRGPGPPAPLSLMLWDKLVVIKSGDGSLDFPGIDSASA